MKSIPPTIYKSIVSPRVILDYARHRMQLLWVFGGPFLASQAHSPLATHACASQWTLAIVLAIICDFASQSHNTIVPTLGDLPPIASTTLMCPLYYVGCADVSTTCVLCAAAALARLLPTPRQGNTATCTFARHSTSGTTDSTAQNVKTTRNNDPSTHRARRAFIPTRERMSQI